MLKMALKNTFSPLPKTFAFWFGALLATLLALLLVARVAFPFWIENKNYISGQLKEFLGSPVTFEHIQGDWSGWSPKFNLSNFSVYDKTNKSIIFSAKF